MDGPLLKYLSELLKSDPSEFRLSMKADYDLKAKTLAVTFDEKKTNVEGIEKAMAAVGHDTDKYKADDAVYNKLPGCCKYRK